MKEIKVLGPGCVNCNATATLIEDTAKERYVDIRLEKITDMAAILSYGVTSTPGVLVDGKLMYSGGVPSKNMVEEWLSDSTSCCGCCGGKG